MLDKAKEKGIYQNYIKAFLGPQPVEGVEKGLYTTTYIFDLGSWTPQLQRYSQSRRTVCRRTERSLEVVPASGSHSHQWDIFQWNSGTVE